MIGQTLGHYRIEAKLGEGGMGVVYRAHDTHLDRPVAIKVLRPDAVANPERKRRFIQEAKAASALNHPNILHIYDIDEADGTDFIAMEYVPGRTLDQLSGGKGLKLNTALGYAMQMADALAKAHAAGIVHRDLKPSNVMVNDDDLVKILDFGLAKLAEPAECDELAPTATMGQRLTEEGSIVGTVTYMSPEQAQGLKVDARSDIFSFGAVLYEMLAGKQAFSRGTRVATLAAILNEEPAPLREVAPGAPPEVERVVERCLRKDPQRRWQSLSDLKLVLQDLKEESESGKLSGAAAILPPRPQRRRLLIPAAALAIVGLAGLGWWMLSRRAAVPAELEMSRLTLDSGLTFDPAISPDGKLAAYSSDREDGNLGIYLQQISGRQPMRLTHHEAGERQPDFSPDGSRIAFRSERDGGGIYVIDTLGGEERKIADRGYRPRFSPDGSTISFVEVPPFPGRGRIYLVPAQGGVPRRFLPEYEVVGYPNVAGAIWSPDGRFLLFQGIHNGDPKTRDWWVVPVNGGLPIATGAVRFLEPTVGIQFQYPCAWTGRYVILVQGTTNEGTHLYRLPITPGSWRISGAPQRLTSGSGIYGNFTMASDGRVLLGNLKWVLHFWSIGLDPIQGRAVGDLQQIAGDDAAKYQPALSRDGSRLAFGSFAALRGRAPEVRVREIASGRETAISGSGSTRSFNPQLSADGSALAYSDQIGGKWVSYIVSGVGGSPQQVCENCMARGFFSDPRELLLEYVPSRLVRQNLATGDQVPVLPPGAGALLDVALAPGDRWLALLKGKPSGSLAIYLVPVKNPPAEAAEWRLVAEDPRDLRTPRWSADGNFLYYLSQQDGYRCIWTQRLDRAARRPTGPAFAALHLHRASPGTFSTAPGLTPIAIARDKMVLALSDVTGNIWMSRLDPR